MDNSDSVKKEEMSSSEDNPLLKQNDFNSSEHVEPTATTLNMSAQEGKTDRIIVQTDANNSDVNESLYRLDKTNEFPLKQDHSVEIVNKDISGENSSVYKDDESINFTLHLSLSDTMDVPTPCNTGEEPNCAEPSLNESAIASNKIENEQNQEKEIELNVSSSKYKSTELSSPAKTEQSSICSSDDEKLEIDEPALEQATGLNLSTSKPQATEIPIMVNNEQSFHSNDEGKSEMDESALEEATGLNLSTSKSKSTEITHLANTESSLVNSSDYEDKLKMDESALEEATGLNLSTSKKQDTEISPPVNTEQSSICCSDEEKSEIDESALEEATGLNLSTSKSQAPEISPPVNPEQSSICSSNDNEKSEIDELALEEAAGLNLSTSKSQATEISPPVNPEQSSICSSDDKDKLEIDESALEEATGLNLSTSKSQAPEISPPVNPEQSSVCSSDDEEKLEIDELTLEEATGLNLSTSKSQASEISPPVNLEQSSVCSSDDKEKLEIDESALEEATGLNLSTSKSQGTEISPLVNSEQSSICSTDDKEKLEINESALEEATGLNLSTSKMLESPLEKSTLEKSLNYSSVDMNSSLMNMDVSMLNISRKKPEENQNLEALTEGSDIPTKLQECKEIQYPDITLSKQSSNCSSPEKAEHADESALMQTTRLNISASQSLQSPLESSTLEKSINCSSVDMNSSLMNMDVSMLNISRKKTEKNQTFKAVTKGSKIPTKILKLPLENSTLEKRKSINYSSVDMNSSLMNMDVSLLNISRKQPEEKPNLEEVAETKECTELLSTDITKPELSSNSSFLDETKQGVDDLTSDQITGLNLSSSKLHKSYLESSTLEKSLNSSMDMNSSLMNMDVSLLNVSRKKPEAKPSLELTEVSDNSTKLQECTELTSPNITMSKKSLNRGSLNKPEQDVNESALEQAIELNLSTSKLSVPPLENSTLEKSLNYSSIDMNSSLMNMDVSLLNISRKKTEKPNFEEITEHTSSNKLQECTELSPPNFTTSEQSSDCRSPDNVKQDVDDSILEKATELNLSLSMDMNASLMGMDVSLLNMSRKKLNESLHNTISEQSSKYCPEDQVKQNSQVQDLSNINLQTELNLSAPKLNKSIERFLDVSTSNSNPNDPSNQDDGDKSFLEKITEQNLSSPIDVPTTQPLVNTSSNEPNQDIVKEISSTDQTTESNLNASIEPSLDKSASEQSLSCGSNGELKQDEDKLIIKKETESNVSLKLNVSIEQSCEQSSNSLNEQVKEELMVEKSSIVEKTKELNVSSTKLNVSIDKSATEEPLNHNIPVGFNQDDKDTSVLEQDREVLLDQSTNITTTDQKLKQDDEEVLRVEEKTDVNVSPSKKNTLDKTATDPSPICSEDQVQVTLGEETTETPSKLNSSLNVRKTQQTSNFSPEKEVKQDVEEISKIQEAELNSSLIKVAETSQHLKELESSSKLEMGSPLKNLGISPLEISKKFEKDEEKSELNLSAIQLNDSADSSSIEILPINQLLEGIESIYEQDVVNVSVSEQELLRSSTPLELSPKIDYLVERPRTCCSTIDEELESLVQDLSQHNESGNDMRNLHCQTPAPILREKLKRAEEIAERLRHDLLELSEFTTYEVQCIKSEKMASSEIAQENEILKKKLAEAESTIEKNVQLVAEISSKIESLTISNESLTSQNKKLSSECELLKIKLTDEEVRVELSDNRWKKMVEELQKSLDEAWRINNRPKFEDTEIKTAYQINGFNDNHPILPNNITVSDISLCLSVSESPVGTHRLNNMSLDNYENPNYTVKVEDNLDNSLEDPLKSTMVGYSSSDESDHDSNFGTPLASQNGDNQRIDDFSGVNEGESIKKRLKYDEFDYFKIQTFLEAITGQKYLTENSCSELDALLDCFTDKIMEAKKIMGSSGTHDFFSEMIEIIHNYQLLQSEYDKLDQTKSGLEYFESIFKGVDNLQDLNDRLKLFNEEQNVSETLKEGITKITRALQNKNEGFSLIENSLKSLESELEDSKFENNIIKEAIKRLALPQQCFENYSDMIKSIERTREEYDKHNTTIKSIKETVKEFANYHEIDEMDIDFIVQFVIKKVKGYEETFESLKLELENSKSENGLIKNSVQDLASTYNINKEDVDTIIKSIKSEKEKIDATYNAIISENSLIKKSINQLAITHEIDETDVNLIIDSIANRIESYKNKTLNSEHKIDSLRTENCSIKNLVKDLASTYNTNEEDVDTIIKSIKSEKEKFDAAYNSIDTENILIKKSINQLAINHDINETDIHLIIESIGNKIENYKSKTLNSELKIESVKTENCSIKNLVKDLASLYHINEDDVDTMIKSIKTEKEKFDAAYNSINAEYNLIKKSINQLAINHDINETDIPLIIESISNKIKSYNSNLKTLQSEIDSLKSENCLIKNAVKEHYQHNNDVDSLTKNLKVMKDKYDSLNLENSSLKESIYQFAKLHHIEHETDVNFDIKSIMDKVNGYLKSIKSELNVLKTEYSMITKSVKELSSDLNIDEDNIDFLIKSIKKNNEEFRTTSENLKSELDQLKLKNSLIEKSIYELAEYHHIKESDVHAIIKSAIKKVEGYDGTFESLKLELDEVKSKKDSINESVKELALIYNIDDIGDINSIIESIKKVVDEQDRKTKTILELINEIPQESSDTWDIISNKIQSLQEHIRSLSSNDNYDKIQELENKVQDADDLKRSFAKELNSLDPNLRVYELMQLPLKDLKDKLFSTFMETERIVIEKMQSTHDENLNVYTDKIKQLEEEQKRKTVWSKELEEENNKLNNECKLIKMKMSQLESEIQDKCGNIEKKEETFKEEIRKLNNSLDEADNKSMDAVFCQQCDTLKQLYSDLSSQLNEKIDCCHQHEKTIEEANKKLEMVNLDLRSKVIEIETNQNTLKSLKEKYDKLHQENKKLTDNNQLPENNLIKTQCEKDNNVLKLKDQINVLMSEVKTLQIKGAEDFSAELASSKAKLVDYETQFNLMKVKYEDDFAKLNQVIAQKDKEIEEILSKLKQAKNKLTNINVWEKKYKDLEIETKESRTRFECLSKNLNDDLKCKSLRIAELDAALKSASNSYQSSLSDKTNECERLSKNLEESKLSCARLENKLISQKDIYFKEKQELSHNLEQLNLKYNQIFNKIQTLIDCVSWDDALVKLKVKISLCEELTKQLEEEKENNKQLDDESEVLYTNIKQLEEELCDLKKELYESRKLGEKSNQDKYGSLEKEYLELKNYQKKSEEYFDKIKKLVNKNTFEEALSDIITNITLCKDLQNELDDKIQNIKELDNENEVLYKNMNDLETELNEAKIKLYEKEKKLDSNTEGILNKLKSIQGENFSLEKELVNKSNEFEIYKQKMEGLSDKIKQIGQKETIEEALLRIQLIINTSNQLQTQLEKQTELYDSVIKESDKMKLEMAKTKKEALKYEAMSRRNDEKLKAYISAQENNTVKIKKLEEEIDIQQKKFDTNIDKLSLELKQVQDKFAQENIKATKLEEELIKCQEELNIKRNEDLDTAQNTKRPLKESQQNEVPYERSREDGITDVLKNESIANLKIQLSKNKAALQSKNELIQSYKTKVLELEKKNQTYKTKLEYCGTEEVRPPVNNFQSDLIKKIQELTQTNESLKNDVEIVKKLANGRCKKLKDYEAYMTKIGMFPPKQECENVSGSSTSNDHSFTSRSSSFLDLNSIFKNKERRSTLD